MFTSSLKSVALVFIMVSFASIALGQTKVLEVNYKKNNNKSYDFTYRKNVPGSYTVAIKFTNLTNARYSSLPHVVKSSSGLLFKLTPIDDSKGISFSWTYRYVSAAVAKKVDDSFEYLLPFPNGTKVEARDSYNVNERYMNGEQSDTWQAYALLADTDTVLCMRKGVVIKVEDDYAVDSDIYFTTNTNKVIIEHGDRTLASYKGFDQNGIVVKPGDIVYPHSFLGVMPVAEDDKQRKLKMMIYYSTKVDVDFNKKKASLSDKDNYTYLKPKFLTAIGVTQLSEGSAFIVDSSMDIIEEEMSRKEKKKNLIRR